mmetsp:Transcript_16962/g.53132  ORF Transcript_16962/g.53132 Transcript_16962/m.53132 type:complete len:110 (+) Transcript_16962:1340-1669(+)
MDLDTIPGDILSGTSCRARLLEAPAFMACKLLPVDMLDSWLHALLATLVSRDCLAIGPVVVGGIVPAAVGGNCPCWFAGPPETPNCEFCGSPPGNVPTALLVGTTPPTR